MHSFDITAVINGHREGLLAGASLKSLKTCASKAERCGLRVELLAILDNADDLTIEVFKNSQISNPEMKIEMVDHADLGFARNTAAKMAQGEWLAFLDADDLWCDTWLVSAYAAAQSDSRMIAWHPELNVYFGASPHLFVHMDMENPKFHSANIAVTNPWTSLCFAKTAVVRSVPYTGTNLKEYVGFEDWSWNIDLIEHGGLHKIVTGTSHAIRTSPTSLVKQTVANGCMPRPTYYFRQLIADESRIAAKPRVAVRQGPTQDKCVL